MAEFEHALFLLLLLVGVLNARPAHSILALSLIAAGFLLALLPPAVQVPLPWDLILGLAIPLLLWQNGRRLVRAGWRGNPVELTLWFAAALGPAFGECPRAVPSRWKQTQRPSSLKRGSSRSTDA